MHVGTVVARRWAIEAIAGTGGMCSVYRARAPSGGLVAVKVLHQSAIDAEERFAREVRLLQDLRHPAIVRYLDSGITEDGERFLVMEWLDGIDVEALLRARSLTLGEVMTLAARVAQALAVAHARGIVHRDVKPSNIFVVGDDVHEAKLLDFGVARWGAESGRAVTVTGTSVGTPAYMAPEQVRGERVIDARADVFALGCVIYECLTGEAAFAAHNPMAVFCKILVDRSPRAGEMVPGLPEPVDELLTSMLAKEPAKRPRDGAAVAAALDSLAAGIEAAASMRRPAQAVRLRKTITGDEQRLVNVLVAGPSVGGANQNAGEARTVRLFPSKVPSMNLTPASRASVRFDALGDGSLIAVFEARGVATDQAMNAARFALALRDEFPTGDIALATGLAVMGKTRLVGEAIDRACQLLLAETRDGRVRTPKGVRLDDVTAGLIGARFDISVDETGPILRGERQATGERTLLGKPTPFVGRVRELTVLTSTLDECVSGHVARAVLVTGQAGSGKSRLVRELLKLIAERGGIEVWSAQGDPMRSGSALDMLAEAVRRLTGVLDGEPLPVRRHKLRAEVSRHVAGGQVTRVSEFLGELLRLPAANDDSVPLRAARQDPMLMGDQVRRAIEDLLDARSADHPVVLVLEDLHWGDAATVAFVDRVLRNLGERRLMIVALARPELHDQFPRIWSLHNVTELRLGPRSRRAAQSLAEAVLGDKLPAERAAELVERADGNPFFLEELLRTAATGVYALPETLLAMMQARIEGLEPEARRVLRAASIFGVIFWRGGVTGLTGEALALDHWLGVLAERELVSLTDDTKFTGERAYRFRHDIVRDAAYALLVDDDRRLGHLLAAEWLERVGETDARALAQHFERAAVPARALPHYLRAAEMALERGDFAAVFDLAARAERCGPDRAELGLLRCLEGDARYWRGEPALAEKRYVEAMALLPRGSRRWYHAAGHAMIVWGADHAVERMEAVGRTLIRHVSAREDDHIGRLVAQAITASRLFLAGRRELAHALLEEAEVTAGDLSEADAVVAAHLHRALASRALVRDADPALFLREMELGADSFEEIGDARETCFQRANIGYAQLELGLYADAERELRSALATAERMALDHVASGARGNLAMALARQGKLRDAIALETRAAAWFEEQKDRRLAGGSRMYLAIILLLDGDLERAEHEARAALALLEDRAPAQATAALASVLLARGATAEALLHAAVAARKLEGGGAFEGEAEVRLVHAEALFASGRLAEARLAIAAAAARLEERAARIGHAEWRQSFLENIPEHVRTLELARAWAGSAG